MQSDNIRERISLFGGKLYLEFGGKLYLEFGGKLPRLARASGFQPTARSVCSSSCATMWRS